MPKNILDFICCPKCKGGLEKTSDFLSCKNCKKQHGIIKGIPNFVDLKGLSEHYRRQAVYFGKGTETKTRYCLQSWQRSYIRRFDKTISISKNDVIVDIGTGSGYMALELAKRGNLVLACDLNLQGLLRLQKAADELNVSSRLFLFACSAEELPIKTGLVSAFILNAVLEHLPREEIAIKEIGRICKKKAHGFVTVPLKLKYIWPFFWSINIIHDKRLGHLRRYDLNDLGTEFSQGGFKVKECFYTGHLVKTLGVLAQSLIKTHRWDKFLEDIDRREENRMYGANNIIVALER